MFASEFDGANDFLRKTTNLTGIVDSKVGLLSFWLNVEGVEGTTRNIIIGQDGASTIMRARLLSDETLRIILRQAGNQTVLRMATSRTIVGTDGWVHILASWDLNAATAREEFYVNDTDETSVSVGPVDAAVVYTNVDEWTISANQDDLLKLTGCLAQVYFSDTEDLDLSVTANRRLFINADLTPVDLGPDGSNPTGNAPILYLDKAPVNFHLNDGTGGDFTQNGTLTECPPPHGVIASLSVRSIFSVVLATTAIGVAGLKKKAKLKLSDVAVGVVTLKKKVGLTLSVIATGSPNLIFKAKLILRRRRRVLPPSSSMPLPARHS